MSRGYIYFAHSLLSYNNDYEAFCLSLIKKVFPNTDIFNPNGKVAQTTDEDAMKHCIAAILDDRCKALVFATTSGIVGQGVMAEVRAANSRKIPIYCIIDNKIFLAADVSFVPVNFSNRVYAVAHVAAHCEVASIDRS